MKLYALHGNLGSSHDWDHLTLPGVEAIDLWQWQESDPGISLEAFGRRFVASIQDSEEDAVILGYSLGGRLALHALAAAPHRWKAVILLSTHPGLDSEAARRERAVLDRAWAARARGDSWDAFLENWNAQPVFQGQAVGADQADLVSRREAIAAAFESWSLSEQEPMDLKLAGCETPVLVVHGERDAKFASLAGRFADAFPGAEIRAIAGAGHRLPLDAPASLSETIDSWLGKIGLRRSAPRVDS